MKKQLKDRLISVLWDMLYKFKQETYSTDEELVESTVNKIIYELKK